MSISRVARLAALLDEMGTFPAAGFTAQFNERLKLQKTVYLLNVLMQRRQLGDLGYRFSWYIRGPYSSAAADDLFSIAGESDKAAMMEGLTLTEQGRQVVADARALLQQPENIGIDDVHWLELLASLHYLAAREEVRNFEQAWDQLQKTKPNLANERQAREAWDRLSQMTLV